MKTVKFKDLRAGEFFTVPLSKTSWLGTVYMKLNKNWIGGINIEDYTPQNAEWFQAYKYIRVGNDNTCREGRELGWHNDSDVNDHAGMLEYEITDNTRVISLRAVFTFAENEPEEMQTRFCPVNAK